MFIIHGYPELGRLRMLGDSAKRLISSHCGSKYCRILWYFLTNDASNYIFFNYTLNSGTSSNASHFHSPSNSTGTEHLFECFLWES